LQVLVANVAVFGHELRVGAITWKSFEKFFLLFSVVWYVAPTPDGVLLFPLHVGCVDAVRRQLVWVRFAAASDRPFPSCLPTG